MASGKGLGKGLAALYGENDLSKAAVRGINIRDIEPNPNQPRRDFDQQSLAELTDSIAKNGVLTPITLRKVGDTYQIIAGERRWRAARAAGLEEIPAYVISADDNTAYLYGLVENLQREDLNPIEEALGYKKLVSEHDFTQDMVAFEVGRSRSYVANTLRLLTLPEELQQLIADGKLSAGHGRALIGLEPEDAVKAATTVINGGFTVRETERMAARIRKEKASVPDTRKKPKENDLSIYLNQIERELSANTGYRIMIRQKARKGKLSIEYYGDEDLENIRKALENLRSTNGKRG